MPGWQSVVTWGVWL